MSRRPAQVPQRDLFGAAPAPAGRDVTPITIPMREVAKGTDKAWHLAPAGVGSAKAAFAPRELVKRGEGDRAGLFTMPRWIAAERGWL